MLVFACPIIVSVGYLPLGQIFLFALKYLYWPSHIRIAPEFKFRYLSSAVEVVRPGFLTHIKYPYIMVSPDAIISCDCHSFNIIEIKCLLDVTFV
jgi:hypothetical protein